MGAAPARISMRPILDPMRTFMNRIFSPRAAPWFARVLAASLLAAAPATAQDARFAANPVAGPVPADGFSVTGQVVVRGFRRPAEWHFDPGSNRALLQVQVQQDRQGWVLLDWAGSEPRGYVGGDAGCFAFRPSDESLPSLQELMSGAVAGDRLGAAGAPPAGLSVVRDAGAGHDFLVLQEPQASVLFQIASVGGPGNADFARETLACRPLQELHDALMGVGRPRAASHVSRQESRIGRNYPYTFHGAIYGGLRYQGHVEEQTKSQYDAALAQCQAEGADTCKPYWEAGGWLGRYGYYCGDGWGTGRGGPLSPTDYVCQLHDGRSWDPGGDTAKNLCGMAAAMTCKHYVSLDDWRVNFPGDFGASAVIGAQLAAALPWILCTPLSSVSGFTCNGLAGTAGLTC